MRFRWEQKHLDEGLKLNIASHCVRRGETWEARTMQNTRLAGKFGTTADNLFMGDTVMDNRIDLQCCIILSPAAGGPAHTLILVRRWHKCGSVQYTQCIVSPAAVTRAPLVCTTWCLVTSSSPPPHPAACVQSSQPTHWGNCHYGTLSCQLVSPTWTFLAFLTDHRLSCCWEGGGCS